MLGGARSGKSAFAESLLDPAGDCCYVATGYPAELDPSWAARLAEHVARRPAAWRTVESLDLAGLLAGADRPLLIDGLGVWLARVLERDGGEVGPAGLEALLAPLGAAWTGCRQPVVAVSDEVGLGVVPSTAVGARFRDLLGSLNQFVAARSDRVYLVVAGLAQRLK